jgi:hypothetical protein
MEMKRKGERSGRQTRSNEKLRHESLNGARRRVARRNAPTIHRDFGAILIDIWRLEIDASD